MVKTKKKKRLYHNKFILFFTLSVTLLLTTFVIHQRQVLMQYAQTGSYVVDGLSGQYFNNKTLSGSPVLQRDDSQIHFDWGAGSPAPTITKGNFSIQWNGRVTADNNGNYTFYVKADDGYKLYVNNKLVLNKWNSQNGMESSATVALQAKVPTPIVLQYYDDGNIYWGNALINLSWSSPSLPKQIIPYNHLSHLSPTPQQIVDFTGNYTGWSGNTNTCSQSYGMIGKEPVPPGKYPVFVYIVGTGNFYDGGEAQTVIQEAAKRGFVAASVAYSDMTGSACTDLHSKAQCIYSGSVTQGAIAQLCARDKADCSKGIVTSGHSQGAGIASLSKNHESRVQAAYVIGLEDTPFGGGCYYPANGRQLPNDRLRVVNGGHAWVFDTDYSGIRGRMQTLDGITCGPNDYSCFRSNGSGWYIVRDTEVKDKAADHCYYRDGGCDSSFNSPFDPGWYPPASLPWSLDTNIDWLKTFTTP